MYLVLYCKFERNVWPTRDIDFNASFSCRFNLTQLEEWCRTNQLDTLDITKPLEPIKEATQLLQVNKKSLDDVDSILSVCATLNPLQVCVFLFLKVVTPTRADFVRTATVVFESHFGTIRLLSLRSSVLLFLQFLFSFSFVFLMTLTVEL